MLRSNRSMYSSALVRTLVWYGEGRLGEVRVGSGRSIRSERQEATSDKRHKKRPHRSGASFNRGVYADKVMNDVP